MKKHKCLLTSLLLLPVLYVATVQAEGKSPAETLNGYAAVRTALTHGKSLSVVIDFGRCDGAKSLNMMGGMPIGSFLVLTPGDARSEYLTFSEYHQMLSEKEATPSVEYVRYKVTQDDTVTLDVHRYLTGTAQTMPPVTYHCKMNTAARFYRQK